MMAQTNFVDEAKAIFNDAKALLLSVRGEAEGYRKLQRGQVAVTKAAGNKAKAAKLKETLLKLLS